MAYLSNIEFHNRGDISGLLTRPVAGFFNGSEQAVINFYWGINGERVDVNSHVMEERGPCPKYRAHFGLGDHPTANHSRDLSHHMGPN